MDSHWKGTWFLFGLVWILGVINGLTLAHMDKATHDHLFWINMSLAICSAIFSISSFIMSFMTERINKWIEEKARED